MDAHDDRFAARGERGWALAALVAGAALTGLGVADLGRIPAFAGDSPRATVAARVNGVGIPASHVDKLVDGLRSERPDLTAAASDAAAHVLERLVDEELLYQRAAEIGLPAADRAARKRAIEVLIEGIVREAEGVEPTRAELERFFEEHRARFEGIERVRVVHLLAGSTGEATRATERLRAGEASGAVLADLGDAGAVPLPSGWLSVRELTERIGPSAAAATLALEPGEVTDPIETPAGARVLVLVERQRIPPPSLDENPDEVRALFRRLHGERALADYVAALRARAVVERLASPAP